MTARGGWINPVASKLVLVRDPSRAHRMVLGAERLDRLAAIYPQSLCDRDAPNARGARRSRGPLGMPRPRRSERSREAIGCTLGVTPSNWKASRSKTIIGCGRVPGAKSCRASPRSIDRAITPLDDRTNNAFER